MRWFFFKVTLHVLWWDIILRRPILRYFRTPHLPRWRKIAGDFRELAVEMGGVLIKLGQFLSVRVDILPEEITSELAGLQDEVPPEPLSAVIEQIESDFGRPLQDIFAWFSAEVLGAASLAQTHRARLHSGETVVVKALRPGIGLIVETDLIPIGEFVRRLKFYRTVRRAVDLDRLIEEFNRVTRQELDLLFEGQSAERFAKNFADNDQIYIPKVYWEYSAAHTLTLEDVGYIQIDDLDGLKSAGIDSGQVVQALGRSYLEQVLIHYFVHADPHSGNLFVKPLPVENEVDRNGEPIVAFTPSDVVPHQPNRPFQIVFVDFGMAVEIIPRLRSSLRNYMIGVGTRDAHRIVQSYVEGDMLLPGADLERLEEMMEALLNQYGDTMIGQAQNVDLFEYNSFIMREYRDVVDDLPFQMPAEMIFVLRAMGLMSGMTALISPDLDPWDEIVSFSQRLLKEEVERNWQDWVREALHYGQIFLRLPKRLDTLLTQAEREKLTVRIRLTPETRRDLRQLRQSVSRLNWTILSVTLLLGGIIWQVGEQVSTALAQQGETGSSFGLWFMVAALGVFLWGLRQR